MPERGEVFLFSQRLNERFPDGSEITKIECFDPDYDLLFLTGLSAVPLELKGTFPLTVKKISSKGKKSYIIFTNGMAMLISYGMTGSWNIKKTKWSRYAFSSSSVTVYWQSKRKLPTEKIEYMSVAELNDSLDRLGYDIYYDTPSEEEILNCYPKRGRNVCSFLLEQDAGKGFAGIGNYIKSIVLYRLNISPHRNTKNLSRKEKIAIFHTAKEIVTEVINMGGHTIHDWALDDNSKLEKYDTTPYGIKGKDKRGNQIKIENIGGRVTYWCPATQV
jgi:formamidopyrimidine-DNA glycosylase